MKLQDGLSICVPIKICFRQSKFDCRKVFWCQKMAFSGFGTVRANMLNVMCKQLLIKSEGSYVTAGEDCQLPREALSFYRGGRGWGALLRIEQGCPRVPAYIVHFRRPTARDSIRRDREKGLLGSRHAVFADGRLGEPCFSFR